MTPAEVQMEKRKKNQKWTKRRHRAVRNILCFFLTPYCRIKYGIRVEKFKEQEKIPYLILLNHQTPFDQFFVGMAFKGPIYYMATEDIFSNGWVSSLIKFLVAPIPIKKQTTDVRAILNCLKVAKEGGTIAIAPEGNRTYSGQTEYMSPSIVPLARKLNMPIALFRIEGGYGAEPRWSNVVRKGKMKAYVSRVLPPEEYAKMSDDELFDIIKSELYVNEANANKSFRHKRCAEYLERAIYVCPECGLSTFESHNDIIECKGCGRRVRYLPTLELRGEGFDHPFPFVLQWYQYQNEYINSLDVTQMTEAPLYRDMTQLREVIPYKNKLILCKSAQIELFGDRIAITANGEELAFPFKEASAVTVLGRNKLNIYHGGRIYQLKGDKRFNALKYVHIYNRFKNITGGNDGKFLGL